MGRLFCGGGRDRTADLGVMNPSLSPSELPRRSRLSKKSICFVAFAWSKLCRACRRRIKCARRLPHAFSMSLPPRTPCDVLSSTTQSASLRTPCIWSFLKSLSVEFFSRSQFKHHHHRIAGFLHHTDIALYDREESLCTIPRVRVNTVVGDIARKLAGGARLNKAE